MDGKLITKGCFTYEFVPSPLLEKMSTNAAHHHIKKQGTFLFWCENTATCKGEKISASSYVSDIAACMLVHSFSYTCDGNVVYHVMGNW